MSILSSTFLYVMLKVKQLNKVAQKYTEPTKNSVQTGLFILYKHHAYIKIAGSLCVRMSVLH